MITMKHYTIILGCFALIAYACKKEQKPKVNEPVATTVTTTPTDPDYRKNFTGNYVMTVITASWSATQTVMTYDTLHVTGKITKFYGYTVGSKSNYTDVIHKIGIVYDSLNYTTDNSWCAYTSYFTEGYLHPTVDTAGNLSYPEMTSCCSGSLSGYIRNDSVNLKYSNASQWYGFTRKIFGKRQ